MGNPFGLGGSVSAGIVSAEHRDIGSGPYDNYLQIDAPVNRGNSGGPAFNTQGRGRSASTPRSTRRRAAMSASPSPSPPASSSSVVNDLKDHGEVTRGWLGVQIQPVTEDIAKSLGINGTDGAIVADSLANGPAHGAGIEAGDIITEVERHRRSRTRSSLSETIAGMNPGERITVTVLRDGKTQDIDVKLGDLSKFDQDAAREQRPGARRRTSRCSPARSRASACRLSRIRTATACWSPSVADGSPAADRGIQAGTDHHRVGGHAVNSPADVESAVAATRERGRDAVLLRVQGTGRHAFRRRALQRGLTGDLWGVAGYPYRPPGRPVIQLAGRESGPPCVIHSSVIQSNGLRWNSTHAAAI